MKITGLKTNRLTNPLGFDLGKQPRLSWIVEGATGTAQRSARIEVSLDPGFGAPVFDSGFDVQMDSIRYPLPLELLPRTRYYWRVSVESDAGEKATSEPAWFETAKMSEPWISRWIAPDFDPGWHPSVFTDIEVSKEVRSARVYVCGLGLYELYINGDKAGHEMLAPGLCAYDKWLPYQTYDIGEYFQAGSNRIEIRLGNGWYKGRYGFSDFCYGEEFACICEVILSYNDGSSEALATNPQNWRACRTPILDSGIFDGEVRDDTLDCTAVYPVKPADIGYERLTARRSPPTRVMHTLIPVEIIRTPSGETVIDMGQNMTGWLEFKCLAPRGAAIHLQFGEVLQNGCFYRDNLRSAKAEYRYVSDGTGKIIRPHFTFYGFRYVKLTEWHGPVNLEDFSGLVLYSDMDSTGQIETDNSKVNRLIQNALWSQRCNFLDVPTDCPQRDERMGWTGDAQAFFGTAAFNMDVYAFFSKYCYDLMAEQSGLGGAVPVVIPRHSVEQVGACAWGDAATIIPWEMYIRYGDSEILRQQYPSMKAWVDYVKGRDEASGGARLWRGDFHYGDWLALDNEDPIGNRFGGTELTFLASCFYRHSAALLSKAAHILGFQEDESFYRTLSEEVRSAILSEYTTSTGRLAVTTQTAYVLALYMDIMPDEWKDKSAFALRRKLQETGCHLRTGFIGTSYLCRVLSGYGSNDIAYRLLLQEDYPSWLYEVNMGATTIWERWNSILPDGGISDTGMNSLNHYAYGSIVEWMYRDAAGINPIESSPGFRQIRLAPKPDTRLGYINAEYLSPVGLIKSGWSWRENELELRFTVPFGSVAELTLPDCEGSGYSPVQELKPGNHVFRYIPGRNKSPAFSPDTQLREMLDNPGAEKALRRDLPAVFELPMPESIFRELSLRELSRDGYIKLSELQIADYCRKLSQDIRA